MNLPRGESDLDKLVKNMQPVLEDEELVFCSLPPQQAEDYFALCQGYYVEREGITVMPNFRAALI